MRTSFRSLAVLLALTALACEDNLPTALADQAVSEAKVAASLKMPGTCTLANGKVAETGFDQFGYNRCAHNFVGLADGVDNILDGKVNGDPTWANDHLVMKWNAEWDRGNAEGWSNPPYQAWENNEWNGVRPDGSGWTEHFKTAWSAECAAGETPEEGTYCIWGQFLVLMDHGTSPGAGHEWWAKAIPAGYGNNGG